MSELNPKLIVISLLTQVEEGKYSNIVLNDYLSYEGKELTRGEKAFITEVFYGVIRNKIFIDTQLKKYTTTLKRRFLKNLLRLSLYQINFMNSDDPGVVWEGVELAKERYGKPQGDFVNAVLNRFILESEKDIQELQKNKDWATLYSYPKWYVGYLRKIYGSEVEEVLKSYKRIPDLAVRRNNLLVKKAEAQDFLESRGYVVTKNILDSIFYLENGSILGSEEFKNGYFSVQDGSSFLAPYFLEPQKGDKILDTCSAPGGKTVTMGELMENEGEILALDIHKHKLRLVRRSASRNGVTIIETKNNDARRAHELTDEWGYFDKILVDAPCSGLGVIRKKPEIIYGMTYEKILELAAIQKEILTSAWQALRVGGELIYSTCTLTTEENTDNAKWFLENNQDAKACQLEIPETIETTRDASGGYLVNYLEEYLDGFYIIKFKKVEV